MVPLLPRAGVLQLNILISLVTVFHVLYCILTMFLGMAKVSKQVSCNVGNSYVHPLYKANNTSNIIKDNTCVTTLTNNEFLSSEHYNRNSSFIFFAII